MVNAIYGLYPDPDSTQRAVNLLRGAGVEAGAIEVVSSEPYEEYDFGRQDHRTPMPWLAVLGGVVGGTCGYLLAYLTQKLYPLPTGGMPIVALWPNAIVTFELTMLGAILVTLLTLLASARLPDWEAKLHDPAVADGRILVGVVNPSKEVRVELERRLLEAGALQVKDFTSPASATTDSET